MCVSSGIPGPQLGGASLLRDFLPPRRVPRGTGPPCRAPFPTALALLALTHDWRCSAVSSSDWGTGTSRYTSARNSVGDAEEQVENCRRFKRCCWNKQVSEQGSAGVEGEYDKRPNEAVNRGFGEPQEANGTVARSTEPVQHVHYLKQTA